MNTKDNTANGLQPFHLADFYKTGHPAMYPAETTRLVANFTPRAKSPVISSTVSAEEAGYADGFDMNYLVYNPSRAIGEAIAGDLRKVGIRAQIQVVELGLLRRLQGDGKAQAWTSPYPTGGNPDAGNILISLFNDVTMKYNNDEVIPKVVERGEAEFDPDARTKIYAEAFDRINTMLYHIPISSVPQVFVHSKDVRVDNNPISAGKIYATDFKWN